MIAIIAGAIALLDLRITITNLLTKISKCYILISKFFVLYRRNILPIEHASLIIV